MDPLQEKKMQGQRHNDRPIKPSLPTDPDRLPKVERLFIERGPVVAILLRLLAVLVLLGCLVLTWAAKVLPLARDNSIPPLGDTLPGSQPAIRTDRA